MYRKPALFALVAFATLSGTAWADADSDLMDCASSVILEQGHLPDCQPVDVVRGMVFDTCMSKIDALVSESRQNGLSDAAIGTFKEMTNDRLTKLVEKGLPMIQKQNFCH